MRVGGDGHDGAEAVSAIVVLEWVGAIGAAAGALLLALNLRQSGWAFPIMTVFTVLLFGVSVALARWPNAALFAAYTAINLLGVYRWLMARPKAS